MKKTYIIPTVKVTAFTESSSLCAATTFNYGGEGSASDCNAKNGYAVFDDDEEEEDY